MRLPVTRHHINHYLSTSQVAPRSYLPHLNSDILLSSSSEFDPALSSSDCSSEAFFPPQLPHHIALSAAAISTILSATSHLLAPKFEDFRSIVTTQISRTPVATRSYRMQNGYKQTLV